MLKCDVPKENCLSRDENGNCKFWDEYTCRPVIDKCEGCENIEKGYCRSYVNPELKWRMSNCPRATHLQVEKKDMRRRRVGQQKQSRRW